MEDQGVALGICLLWVALVVVVPTWALTRWTRKWRPFTRWIVIPLPSLCLVLSAGLFLLSRQSRPSASAPTPSAPLEERAPASVLPSFPWPPPSASARLVIPQQMFRERQIIGQLASELSHALDGTGYLERSYYAVPGGIAIVTRLEHIYENGRSFSGEQRWVTDDEQVLSLSAYVERLFAADAGYYRVIVFVITDQPFGSSDRVVSSTDATAWLGHGFNEIPLSVLQQSVSSDVACTALIYEFLAHGGREPRILVPSPLGARQHLVASGLLAALSSQH